VLGRLVAEARAVAPQGLFPVEEINRRLDAFAAAVRDVWTWELVGGRVTYDCDGIQNDPVGDELTRRSRKLLGAVYPLTDLARGASIRPAKVTPNDPQAASISYKHSTDFATVVRDGITYHFTDTQKAVVKILFENWITRTPGVSQAFLLEQSGSDSRRLRDVFKKGGQPHAAWGTIIVPAKGQRNLFRLTGDPPEII
jgi:hypothetical protein